MGKEIFERGKSGDAFTKEESAFLDQGPVLFNQLHLEIESFDLFAKIFLDKIANFLEFYFESARGLSLDSHDQLVISSETGRKGVELFVILRGRAAESGKTISVMFSVFASIFPILLLPNSQK